MKFSRLFYLLLAFITGSVAHTQTIYHLSYKSPLSEDTNIYDAFFIQQDNGSGSVRISYTMPGNKKVIYEMEFQQEFPITKGETYDTTWVVCRGSKPVVKAGDKRVKPVIVVYWFRLNSETGQYAPYCVTAPDMNMYPGENNFISVTAVTDQAEMRSLVKNFFLSTEAFYKSLFDPKKRGSLLNDEEKTTKIHLLIVAMTKDSVIGNSAMLDVRRAIKTFGAVAEALTLKNNFFVDTVIGENYNRTNILKAINKLNPQRGKDIVIFYYSGHGFTNPKQPAKKFPFLDLLNPLQNPRPLAIDSAMNIEDIYTILKQKGARLNLVISDCCNNRMEDKPIKKPAPPGHRGEIDMTKWNKANVKSLFFFDKPLSMLATAATKGERAASNDRYGGFYSNNFLLALTSYFSYDKAAPLWLQVFADAQKQTIWQADHTYCPEEKRLCHQTPPPPKVN